MFFFLGEKFYVCDVCGKVFLILLFLNIYWCIYSGEKLYVCKVCGKCFIVFLNFYYYRMMYDKVKYYNFYIYLYY